MTIASEMELSAEEQLRRNFESSFGDLDAVLQQVGCALPVLSEEHSLDSSPIESDEGFEELSAENNIAQPAIITAFVDDDISTVQSCNSSQRAKFFKAKLANLAPKATKGNDSASQADNADAQPESSRDMLKNDLQLQKLLRESHLLARDRVPGVLEPTGKTRWRLQQEQMQSLSKQNIDEPIPLKIRRGIDSKRAQREHARIKTAGEQGIVIATEKKKKQVSKPQQSQNELPGKFKDGTLIINRRKIEQISGDADIKSAKNRISRSKSHGKHKKSNRKRR